MIADGLHKAFVDLIYEAAGGFQRGHLAHSTFGIPNSYSRRLRAVKLARSEEGKGVLLWSTKVVAETLTTTGKE
jgi:hypothetical protein